MRTPLPLAYSYFAGLALALAAPGLGTGLAMPLGCLGVGTLSVLATGRMVPALWQRLSPWLLMIAAIGGGLCVIATPNAQASLPPAGAARMLVDVEEVRYERPDRAQSRVRVLSGARLDDGAVVPRNTRLIVGPYPLPEGARIKLLATLRPSMPFRNPSPHPPLPAAHPTRGHALLVSASAFAVVEHAWYALALDRSRSYLRRRFWATLPDDVAQVACALLLGDPDALDDEDDADVRGAGLAHVFAVSGMHVTLLAGLAVWLLTRALLRIEPVAARWDVPRLASGLGIPFALSIAAFTGGAPSGWRASITTAIAWTVVACGRRPNGPAVTAAACLLFAAISPADALRPAFLLSIAATAAILSDDHAEAPELRGALRSAGMLTLRTSLATAPIVWWTFGGLPLVGMLANLLLVPVGSVLLLLTAAHAVFATGLPVATVITAAPLSIVSRAFLRGCAELNRVDPHFVLPVPSLAQGIVVSVAACVMLFTRNGRLRWSACALGVLLCLAFEWQLRRSEQPQHILRATFLDVGQGDSALIDLPDGRAMLIDAGGNPQGGPDPGERVLLPLLRARRRTRLDVVVLTHPHPDHYGGLAALFEAVQVGELWDSGQSAGEADLSGTSKRALELLNKASSHGTRIMRPAELCQRPRYFGEARVDVLWPCPSFDAGFEPNDNSLVLRIALGTHAMLFSGDVEAHAEAALVARHAPLRADLLKVPHHGSRTSSSDAFLAAISPSIAVISAGAVNPFGHPHPEVLQRLQRRGVRVIDVGETGASVITLGERGLGSDRSLDR